MANRRDFFRGQVKDPRFQQALAMDDALQMEAGKMPSLPSYISGYDPETDSTLKFLQSKYDPTGFNRYRQEALQKGPSPWASLAKQSNVLQESAGRESAAAEANAQSAQMMDRLAARGGLSSGARERAGMEGAKNYLAMSQDLGRQGNLNELQIGMNDEKMRRQALATLPGMEMSQAQMFEGAKGKDIANMQNETARRNLYNQGAYGEQMKAWAANKQAQATENSGKK